jgi:hypothetical protein
MELIEPSLNRSASDKDVLYTLAGVTLIVFGTGLILLNPHVRRYMSQIGVGNLFRASIPDIERYLKLRAM